MDTASKVIEDCNTKVSEIVTVLRSLDGISAKGLAELMLKSSNFKKKTWTEVYLEPANQHTWRRVLLADNNGEFREPDRPGRRLRDVIDWFELADLSDLPAPATLAEWRDWFNEVHKKLQKNQQRPRRGLSEDLQFIGTVEQGIDRFILLSEDATVVYNTVFTRSEPQSRYARDLSFRLEDVKRSLLRRGSAWIELVLEKEVAGLMPYLQQINEERKNYHAVILPNLPMFQCLVFRRTGNNGAAFVGWFVPGSGESRVFFTDEWENVQYFLDYCEKLYRCSAARELIIPPRDEMPGATEP
jgi:hypothetical protein